MRMAALHFDVFGVPTVPDLEWRNTIERMHKREVEKIPYLVTEGRHGRSVQVDGILGGTYSGKNTRYVGEEEVVALREQAKDPYGPRKNAEVRCLHGERSLGATKHTKKVQGRNGATS